MAKIAFDQAKATKGKRKRLWLILMNNDGQQRYAGWQVNRHRLMVKIGTLGQCAETAAVPGRWN
nr:hypothetical protein [Avibacterium paragallinarum]